MVFHVHAHFFIYIETEVTNHYTQAEDEEVVVIYKLHKFIKLKITLINCLSFCYSLTMGVSRAIKCLFIPVK